jgi:hypothetical protein
MNKHSRPGARGANQYRARRPRDGTTLPAPDRDLAAQAGTEVSQRTRCGTLYFTNCYALVGPPTWSHGRHPSEGDQRVAARAQTTPGPVLARLALSRSQSVRQSVAENRNTTGPVLAGLAADPHVSVRAAAARHSRTPGPALSRLADDHDMYVRALAAANPHLPVRAMRRLYRDPEAMVRFGLAANRRCPPRILEQFHLQGEDFLDLHIARNPGCPAPLLEQLLRHHDPQVAQAAIDNPALPRYLRAFSQLAGRTA